MISVHGSRKLGSSQASDLAFVVLFAISQCVKPSCKDRREHPSAASKSVERVELQGVFVTTLETIILPQRQAHHEGSKVIYDKVYTKPSRTHCFCTKYPAQTDFHASSNLKWWLMRYAEHTQESMCAVRNRPVTRPHSRLLLSLCAPHVTQLWGSR